MNITVNGISVNHTLEGPSASPVVMLSHSLATNLTMWEPQMEALTARYQVLCYDTRGHGGTDAPVGAYSLEQLAADAQALLETLGIDRTHFIGLSLGGMIGQTLALKAPHCLSSLVLCDTSSRVPHEAKAVWDQRIHTAESQGMESLVEPTIARWFTPSFRERRTDIINRVRAMIRGTPSRGYVGCCHAIAGLNLTDRLKAIALPTLVVVGEEDPGTPVAAARVIHEQISGSELTIIRSASHLSNMEQPEDFNRVVAGFIGQVG